jgi:disulfide bond formation protein DsbB
MVKNINIFLFLLGLLISLGTMGYVLFLEHHNHLIPCSLCIFQRIAVIFSSIIFLIALIHGLCLGLKRKTFMGRLVLVYAVLGILVALTGLAFSLRQIYLQSLPPSEVPGCGPGVNFLFKAYPFLDALKIVLEGSGDCAKVDWRGLGLSLADWSGIYFVGLLILNAAALGFNKINTRS